MPYDNNIKSAPYTYTDKCPPEERAKAAAILKQIADKPVRRIKNTDELRAMGYGQNIYSATPMPLIRKRSAHLTSEQAEKIYQAVAGGPVSISQIARELNRSQSRTLDIVHSDIRLRLHKKGNDEKIRGCLVGRV